MKTTVFLDWLTVSPAKCSGGCTRAVLRCSPKRLQLCVARANPKHSIPVAMFIRTLLIYTLSFTVGIGAVTHAKTQLTEQPLQDTIENLVLVGYKRRPDGYLSHMNEAF